MVAVAGSRAEAVQELQRRAAERGGAVDEYRIPRSWELRRGKTFDMVPPSVVVGKPPEFADA